MNDVIFISLIDIPLLSEPNIIANDKKKLGNIYLKSIVKIIS